MSESLLNLRFRATKVKYEELLIALENIIIDCLNSPDNQTEESRHEWPDGDRKGHEGDRRIVQRYTVGKRWQRCRSWKGQRQRKEAKTRRKAARVIAEHVGFCGKAVRIAALCPRSEQRNFYAIEEEELEINEEALHNDEELQEQRLLDLGEHEQWQEVISRREKPLMPHYGAWEATQTRARRKHRGENVS